MFCWMSAMCFDLGWTFARDRLRLPSSRGSDGLTFALYATFAGAVPAALLAWVVVDDMSGDGGDDGGLRTRPSVGAGSCFLSVAGLIKYFYIPVSVLLTFNAVAFGATVRSLWRSRQFARSAGLARNNSVQVVEKRKVGTSITNVQCRYSVVVCIDKKIRPHTGWCKNYATYIFHSISNFFFNE